MIDPGYSAAITDAKRRSLLLVAIVAVPPAVVVGVVLGLALSWIVGVILLVVLGVALAGWVWWGSEGQATRLLGGDPADPVAHARLINLVDGLGTAIGVPPPELRVVPDPGLNAATFGRDPRSAVLVVTSGLLDELNRIELEGVLARELVRIKNQEIRPATVGVAATGGGLVAVRRAATSSGLVALLLTGWAALFVPARSIMTGDDAGERDALLDRSAVAATRYPPGLLGALEKLQAKGTVVGAASPRTAHLWLADPLPPIDGDRWPAPVFGGRLSLGERIEALREL